MNLTVLSPLTESARGVLYDLPVATDEFLTVEQARKTLGKRLKMTRSQTEPVSTVVTMHGHPEGVIVSVEFYQRAREMLGEPVNWQFAPPPKTRPKADATTDDAADVHEDGGHDEAPPRRRRAR